MPALQPQETRGRRHTVLYSSQSYPLHQVLTKGNEIFCSVLSRHVLNETQRFNSIFKHIWLKAAATLGRNLTWLL